MFELAVRDLSNIMLLSRTATLSARSKVLPHLRCASQPRRFLEVHAGADSSLQAFLEPVSSHPGIACLSLNRPKSKNAISMSLLQQLRESLDTVHYDKR